MFNVLGQLNWLAIAVATVASFVIGGFWFTAAFGKQYAVALGRDRVSPSKPAAIFIVGPFLWALLTSIASAVLMHTLGVNNVGDGLVFGTIVGFGFLAATTANTAVNPNIPRPVLYGVISGSYHLVAGLTISLVLVAMP
jgi:Protein of unknown function (DUF1761)